MDLIAIISADIVASTSISVDSMLSLNESNQSYIVDIEEQHPELFNQLKKMRFSHLFLLYFVYD